MHSVGIDDLDAQPRRVNPFTLAVHTPAVVAGVTVVAYVDRGALRSLILAMERARMRMDAVMMGIR